MAIKRPDLVRKLVTIGSNFSADGVTAEGRAALTPGSPTSIVPGMGALWEVTAVDPAGFDAVMEKMQRCWFDDYEIPKADLARIEAPTLVMVGDDDIATFEHTLELWETIPDSQLAAIPGASHLVPAEKADIVNRLVLGSSPPRVRR